MSAGPLSEGVYAGFWRRLGANLIDVLLLIGFMRLFSRITINAQLVAVLVALCAGAVHLVYTICLHATYGQTLGKMAVGIRVLRSDGSCIGWREALWRSSVDLASWALYSFGSVMVLLSMPAERFVGTSWTALQREVGSATRGTVIDYLGWLSLIWFFSELVTLLFNEKKRAIHDFIAGTVVALKGAEAEVRATQFWQGAPITVGRMFRVGLRSIGVIAAGIIVVAGWAYFITRTDIGVALGERFGVFADKAVDVAPGVRLARPRGWSLTNDLANGYHANSLGSGDEARVSVWSVPIEQLQGADASSDLSAFGPAVAAEQRSRANKALENTWAAGSDMYAGYKIERSRVVSIERRSWGEDFLIQRDHGRTYVLINRYTVHGHHVIVVVDGYRATSGEAAEQSREDVVAPVFHALEFS